MRRIIKTSSFPTGPEGLPLGGYVQVGTASDGDLYLDAEPRAEVPDGATELSGGTTRYNDLLGTAHEDYVMEAVWEDDLGKKHRGKIIEGKDAGHIPSATKTGLQPHKWLGE